MTTFAEKLKAARKGAGLTQQGMADLMLIPRRTIQDWERGLFTPPPYVQRLVLNELETVRCKDCEHYIPKDPPPSDPLECPGDCCVLGCDIWPDDFCSYAKRKEP